MIWPCLCLRKVTAVASRRTGRRVCDWNRWSGPLGAGTGKFAVDALTGTCWGVVRPRWIVRDLRRQPWDSWGEQWDNRSKMYGQSYLQANAGAQDLMCVAPRPHLTSESHSEYWAVGSPLFWGIGDWRARLGKLWGSPAALPVSGAQQWVLINTCWLSRAQPSYRSWDRAMSISHKDPVLKEDIFQVVR